MTICTCMPGTCVFREMMRNSLLFFNILLLCESDFKPDYVAFIGNVFCSEIMNIDHINSSYFQIQIGISENCRKIINSLRLFKIKNLNIRNLAYIDDIQFYYTLAIFATIQNICSLNGGMSKLIINNRNRYRVVYIYK